ncbi:MAG: Crp/Fnr family transcriptional regulator, partial [Pyrinomonadaceae bacterium]|nr:Crp/Fnr family transcriptional regulator [Pyrinomonadaceae bacterium]
MPRTIARNTPQTNRIIGALPENQYQRLQPFLKPVEFEFGKIIQEQDELIRDVYFVNSGIVSLISAVDGKSSLELGMIGREGMVGLPAFLGVSRSAHRALVQGEGEGFKLEVTDLHNECGQDGTLSGLLLRYTHAFLLQITQSAICNQYHRINTRLARWLLMMHHRMGADEFRLTQEFLSSMLGVRREAVSRAAKALQDRDLIQYSRGMIKILDLAKLKAAACN